MTVCPAQFRLARIPDIVEYGHLVFALADPCLRLAGPVIVAHCLSLIRMTNNKCPSPLLGC